MTSHVTHGQQGRFTEFRNIGGHAFARRQGAARKGRPPHRFTVDRVGAVLRRLHDHVIGLRDGNAELVNHDRLHIIAVGLHDGQLQPRNPDVEIGHRRGIDESEPHPLAGPEQAGPVLVRAPAVDQRGETLQILDIGRHHAHVTPVAAVPESRTDPLLLRVIEEVEQGALLAVVVVRHHLQIAHDPVTRMRVRIGKLDHVFAVIAVRLPALRFDDDGPVGPVRLLETGMAVEPVGPALTDGEAIGERFPRRYTGIADLRHAILLKGQDQAVPVHRRVLVEVVGHVDRDFLALPKPQNGAGTCAVETDTRAREGTGVDLYGINGQIVFAGRGTAREGKYQTGTEHCGPEHGHS